MKNKHLAALLVYVLTFACNSDYERDVAESKNLVMAAEKLMANKKYQSAEAILKNAINLDNTNARAYHDIATCKYCNHAPVDSIIYYYKKAKRIDPYSPLPSYELACYFFELDMYDSAFTESVICLGKIDKNISQNNERISNLYQIIGNSFKTFKNIPNNYDSSIFYFKKAIEFNHINYSAYGNLANLYMLTDKYEDGIIAATISMEMDSSYTEIYNMRGICATHLGKYDMALKDFNTAIRQSPKTATYYNNRGLLYKKINDRNKARADFAKADSMGDVYAKDNLKNL